jgi:hypothetical protein
MLLFMKRQSGPVDNLNVSSIFRKKNQVRMFIRTLEQKRQQLTFCEGVGTTGRDVANCWAARHGLSPANLPAVRLEQNGRPLADWDALLDATNGPVTVMVGGGLPGGKGGFGSMLR